MRAATQGIFGLLVESGAKTAFGPMEQDSQVLPIHSKFLADFVFVLFFQEDSAQEVAVALLHFGQDFAHLFLCFPRDQGALQIQNLLGAG